MLRTLGKQLARNAFRARPVLQPRQPLQPVATPLATLTQVRFNKVQLPTLPVSSGPVKKQIRKSGKLNELKAESKLMRMVVLSTAESYDLEDLSMAFNNKWTFREMDISEDIEDNVVPYEAGDQGDGVKRVFFFREGTIACWNLQQEEIDRLLDFIQPFELKPYDRKSSLSEMEEMHFQYSESRAQLIKGVFRLSRESKDALLEQYAFSNATALSVKLAVLESSLNSYIDGIQFITEDMKNGNRVSLNREQVFRKTGGLYALRHHINLRSDLLDTPDFYWDRQDLEKLFTSTCLFLNISKRTKVMNEKLNYCTELMALLSHHLNDIHHVRLEWMIIILIMVEVGFEVIHYIGH